MALGGNVGDVRTAFREALAALPALRVRVCRRSSLYRTKALMSDPGRPSGSRLLERRGRSADRLEPEALLGILQELEARAGRVRRAVGSRGRSISICLLYGERVLESPFLTLPHPRLAERTFVLQPLVELDPDQRIPPSRATASELLASLGDPDQGILEVVADPGS